MFIFKILSVFLIIFIGAIVRKKGLISSNSIKDMSVVITKVFYPSLIFSSFVKNFNSKDLIANWVLSIGTILIMGSGYIYGIIFSKFIEFKDGKEKNTFHFQCTINNYSFLPLTIILFLYGEREIPKLILSTFGSEISVWTFGILALTGNKIRKESFKNLLSVPLISIIFSVITIFLKNFILIENKILLEFGNCLLNTLSIMGTATIPVALFLAGAKMGEIEIKKIFVLKSWILSFIRLILVPVTSILLFNLFSFPYDVKKILTVVAIMPTAIASIVLSETFESDSEFAAQTVLLTHLLSLITIPVFLSFLK